MEKYNLKIWKDNLIGLNAPKYIFENYFMPDFLGSKDSNETLLKTNSYLFFGAAGNGKTFFVNKIIEMCRSKTEIIECWSLKQSFDFNQYLNQREKLIIYFKDIDVIFSHEDKAQIKEAFVRFMSSKSSNIFVIADTNKIESISNSLTDLFNYKVYFDFPTSEERVKMLKFLLPINFSKKTIDSFTELSKGFTFSDIVVLIRDAEMMPIRRLMKNNADINENQVICDENDLLESLKSIKPSYSETERENFLNTVHIFNFIYNISK